jgi:hypothetical protein
MTLLDQSGTRIEIEPGFCRDQTNTNNIVLTETVSINPLALGANGLDTGVMIANSLYYVYVISDSTLKLPPVGIISKADTSVGQDPNQQAPLYPFGYDIRFRLGAIFTDESANYMRFVQRGAGSDRTMWYREPIQVLTNGSAVSDTIFNINPYIPLIETNLKFKIEITPFAAGGFVTLRSAETNPPGDACTISGSVAGVPQICQGDVPVGFPATGNFMRCKYKVSNAGDVANVWLLAYEDLLITNNTV